MIATDTRTAIREATEADLPVCVAMGLRFAREEYAGKLDADADALLRLGQWLLTHGTILVAEKDAVVGMIGLAVLPHIMTGRLYASELFLWVEPEHRGFGVRLIRRGEQWARERGAESLQLVSPSLAVNALYARLGYTQVETAFQRSLMTHTQSDSVGQSAHTS